MAYGHLLLVVLDWQTQDGLRLVARDQVHLCVEPGVLQGTHTYLYHTHTHTHTYTYNMLLSKETDSTDMFAVQVV